MEALRGEIGASMVKSRIMETIISYMMDVMKSDFTSIKNMMGDTIHIDQFYIHISRKEPAFSVKCDILRFID